MRLARTPRSRAEELRRKLNSIGGVRKDRKIVEDGGMVLIPISENVSSSIISEMGLEIVEGETASRYMFRSPMEQILEVIDVEDWMRPLLPRKWEKIGDIVIMRFPEEIAHKRGEIAETYARVLGAKTVCADVGGISGTYRKPVVEVVLGTETETTHRENGIRYMMDVTKTMFSSGNVDERQRMGELDCSNETVVDMFAGIGYFTLPVAVHGGAKRVIACEINPDAQDYLERNIQLNGVDGIVEVFKGDNRDLPGSRFASRVIMGYVATESFLEKGIGLARPGGVVHFHDTIPVDKMYLARESIERAAGDREVEITSIREVKSYAPAISHIVADIRVLG
jgi:tRNA wybutosine-synthesizing protein 2